eukprot:TRINITY_DN3197_c0_g1_i1.p1 TRINITY_DN3197_c0_g1~~TRINITY_DN3197_c0_g1_i1.p1  ORF type:complete len:166 (-),score=18.69 TRINITY_DN3197_c0_g1_i1:355-852(-)
MSYQTEHQKHGMNVRSFHRDTNSMSVYAKDKYDLQNLTRHWRNGTMSEYFRDGVYSRPPVQYSYMSMHKTHNPLMRHPHFLRRRRIPMFYQSNIGLVMLLMPCWLFVAMQWRRGFFNFFNDDYVELKYADKDIESVYGDLETRRKLLALGLPGVPGTSQSPSSKA